jgi:hypothetical protein
MFHKNVPPPQSLNTYGKTYKTRTNSKLYNKNVVKNGKINKKIQKQRE